MKGFITSQGIFVQALGGVVARDREKWCRSFKAKYGKHLWVPLERKSTCFADGLEECELVSGLVRVDRLLLGGSSLG